MEKKSVGRPRNKNYRDFYGPLDKGAGKPAFCYPERVKLLKEEVQKMEKNLEMGFVSPERKLAYKSRLVQKTKRLDAIKEGESKAHKVLNENKDYWVDRRKELAEEIRAGMPSVKDVEKRRVNPYRVAKREQAGLGAMKREYIVVSRMLGEESNTSFLQRD